MINVAENGHAIQSSLSKWSYSEDEANNALSGTSQNGYAFHTQLEKNAWWLVDLKKKYLLSFCNVYLRDGFESRNYDINIEISTDLVNWRIITNKILYGKNLIYSDLGNEEARFLKINISKQYLHLKKVEVFVNDKLIKFRDCILVNDERIHPDIWKAIIKGSYEKAEINYTLKNTTNTDRILELGASIGVMSTIINKHCNPKNYTAVEANKDLIEIINKNHQLNKVKCNVINAAASDKDGTMDFYIHKECVRSSLAPFFNPIRIDKINTFSLETLLNKSEANFLICDIEGAEYNIFNNNIDLSKLNKICLELHTAQIDKMINLYNFIIREGFICDKPVPDAERQYVYFFKRNIK